MSDNDLVIAHDTVIAFAGPSLAADDRARLSAEFGPALVWRPPAARGDALRALRHRPRAMVLIDGFFHARPAIPHKELLYVLDAGVRVIGAASLGALRAAELGPLGMEGVGTVVRWFSDGRIEGDDEVAVLHEPFERDHRPTTHALVEIRWLVEVLVRARNIERPQADALVSEIAELPYIERRTETVAALARTHLGAQAEHLVRGLGRVGLKTRDARRGIRRAFEFTPRPVLVGERHTETRYLAYYREWSLGIQDGGLGTDTQATLGNALRLAQLFHPGMPDWWDALRREFLLASVEQTLPAGAPADRKAIEHRIEHGADRLRTALDDRVPLPPPELEAEARRIVEADAAIARHGGVEAALAALAAQHGLPGTVGDDQTVGDDEKNSTSAITLIDHLSRVQLDAIPVWVAIRAFATTPALLPALDLARRVAKIRHAFRASTGRQRIAQHEGLALAAELWSCPADAVVDQAARRGLYPGDGYSPGLHDVLADVLPAERLGQPIADYEAAKTALGEASLSHPLRSRDAVESARHA